MKKIVLVLLTVAVLSGCATVQPIPTGSGMPEVTICGVRKNEVMEKFAAGLSMKGVNIRNTSNYQIVVGKPVDNPLIAALYGSKYDSTPEARIIFTFADINNCTYIGARLQIVTNPGSGFERITDISKGKDAYQLQQELEELKSTVERQRPVDQNAYKQKRPDDETWQSMTIEERRQEVTKYGITIPVDEEALWATIEREPKVGGMVPWKWR